uniref:DUF2887 domain-containing protein n=1 Tax=Heterorhabditis bacteriophora TaxID=37862 RepID=A0A1I7WZQ4_HETBA
MENKRSYDTEYENHAYRIYVVHECLINDYLVFLMSVSRETSSSASSFTVRSLPLKVTL